METIGQQMLANEKLNVLHVVLKGTVIDQCTMTLEILQASSQTLKTISSMTLCQYCGNISQNAKHVKLETIVPILYAH